MQKTSKILMTAAAAVLAGFPAFSADLPDSLSEHLWQNRPLIVFADTPEDPRLIRQLELLDLGQADLDERDVVVIVDTDGNSDNPMREALRPRGFTWVLIGKDGTVKLRKPHPWTTRELGRVIDKMPLRQQEMRQRWEK